MELGAIPSLRSVPTGGRPRQVEGRYFANALASDFTDGRSIGRDLAAPAAARARVQDLAATSLAGFDLDVAEGNGRTRSDVEAHYAAGLQLVSAAQGLPAGQLDFTRMSDRQLRIVSSHMLASGSADVDTLDALGGSLQPPDAQSGCTPVYSDEPVNRFAWLRARIDYDVTHDSPAAASFGKRALSLIRNMHESTGVEISYVEPTGPSHDARAEVGTTKLKEALDAFRTEASLTPVQRARRDVLRSMKVTEDDLKAMSVEPRKALEKRIAEEIVFLLKRRGQTVPADLANGTLRADADPSTSSGQVPTVEQNGAAWRSGHRPTSTRS